MSAPILVTYASRYGATQETADVIATVLREHGLNVEVKALKEVSGLEPYRAVVLGTALYMGKWYKATDRFLASQQLPLTQRPVAVFALGPIQSPPSEAEFAGALEQLGARLGKHPWLAPAATAVFGGKYDPSHLRFPDGLIAGLPASPLKGMPASDIRDWAAIRAWAEELAARLRAA